MRIIMKKKICVIILFFLLLVIDCSLLQQIQKRAAFYIAFEPQEFFQKLRNQEVSPETVLKFREYESEDGEAQDDMTFTRYLLRSEEHTSEPSHSSISRMPSSA